MSTLWFEKPRNRSPDEPIRGTAPKWDPLRYDQLPRSALTTEFVSPWTEPAFKHSALPDIGLWVLGGSVAAFVAGQVLIGLAPFLALPDAFIAWVLAAVGGLLAAYVYRQTLPDLGWAVPALYVACLLTAWRFRVDDPTVQLIGVLGSLAVLAWGTGSVVSHAMEEAFCTPTWDPECARAWKETWSRRRWRLSLSNRFFGSLGVGDDAKYLRRLRRYHRPYVLFLAVVGFLSLSGVGAAMIVVAPLLALLWVLPGAGRGGFKRSLLALGHMLQSWLTYGLRGEYGPGQFRSPAGIRSHRIAVGAGMLLIVGANVAGPFPIDVLTEASAGGFLSDAWTGLFFGGAYALLPGVVTLSFLLAASGRFYPFVRAAMDPESREGGESLFSAEHWKYVVSKLRGSEDPLIRRQLLVGFHATVHYPILLPIKTLQEHVHVVGGTGSGKTSRAILPLISQLCRLDLVLDAEHVGPIIVIDLKDDETMFPAVRHEAERAGKTFRFFSTAAGSETHAFNPYLDLRQMGLPRDQITSTLQSAFNLEHGTGYGMSHFSGENYELLANLIEQAEDARSIADLYRYHSAHPARTREEREKESNAQEMIRALKRLSERPELNATLDSVRPEVLEARIDMTRALRQNEVVYFRLPSRAGETAARFVASLAMECLYTACMRARQGGTKLRGYAVIDEFQIAAGRNFQLFLQQARSEGLALILANQSREDLVRSGLTAVLDENTSYRQFFTARTPESLSYLRHIAGEMEEVPPENADPERVMSRAVHARFSSTELLALSANEDMALAIQGPNRDFSRFDGLPIPMRSPYHITLEEKRAIEETAPPAPARHLLTVGGGGILADELPAERSPQGRKREEHVAEPVQGTPLSAVFGKLRSDGDGYVIDA